MAVVKNLTVYQGDDKFWPLRLAIVDTTDPANPVQVPLDLNDYTFTAQIRTAYADDTPDVVCELTFDIIDATAGYMNMVLSGDDSVTLTGRQYRWDLQMTRNSDGAKKTLFFGTVGVQKEVTR